MHSLLIINISDYISNNHRKNSMKLVYNFSAETEEFGVGAPGFQSRGFKVQYHCAHPRLTQPFNHLSSIQEDPRTTGDLVVKVNYCLFVVVL